MRSVFSRGGVVELSPLFAELGAGFLKLATLPRSAGLEEVAEVGDTAEGDNVREEEIEVAPSGVGARVGHPGLERIGVLIRRGVNREVFTSGKPGGRVP